MGGFCPGRFCPRGDFVPENFVGGVVQGDFVLEPFWSLFPSAMLMVDLVLGSCVLLYSRLSLRFSFMRSRMA